MFGSFLKSQVLTEKTSRFLNNEKYAFDVDKNLFWLFYFCVRVFIYFLSPEFLIIKCH